MAKNTNSDPINSNNKVLVREIERMLEKVLSVQLKPINDHLEGV